MTPGGKACSAASDASRSAAVRTCQYLLAKNLCCTNLFRRVAPNVHCFLHY